MFAAITEFKLAATGDGSSGQVEEITGPQAASEAHANTKGRRQPVHLSTSSADAPFVPRDMFPTAFGKQRKMSSRPKPDKF